VRPCLATQRAPSNHKKSGPEPHAIGRSRGGLTGYPSKKNRAWLRERGIKATIPERDDQIEKRRKKPDRRP